MKTKIIYHKATKTSDCPDGITAAWIAAKAYSIDYGTDSIEGWTYGEIAEGLLPNVADYDCIVIVDFAFSKQVLEQWAQEGKVKIVVIDHHKTAMHDLSKLSDYVTAKFDIHECGATLAWKTLFPIYKMPDFLNYVRDRDLWKFDLPYSEEINEAIAALRFQSAPDINKIDHVFSVFEMLYSMTQEQLIRVFAPWGYQLLKPKRERIAELAKLAKPIVYNGDNILVVEVAEEKDGRLISDLCSYLYKNNPEFAYICAYTQKDGQINLSFRSNQKGTNYDVSSVAKALNGGGHHNAAGATVNQLPWD